MKTTFPILLVIIGLNTHIVRGQTVFNEIDEAVTICFYDYYWQPDSLDFGYIRSDKTMLLVGENYSLYYAYGIHFRDSVFIANPDINFFTFRKMDPPRARDNIRIYKNYPVGNITTFDYVLPDMYQYEENLDLFDWELSGETDVISGYPVQKATTYFGGREWIAWFAPQIPFSDGPYKFRGLPGLILQVEDSRQHHVFKINNIVRPEPGKQKINLFSRRNIIETNKSQFFEIRERFHQDVLSGLITSGMPVHKETDIDRAQENLRRRNNPIELKGE